MCVDCQSASHRVYTPGVVVGTWNIEHLHGSRTRGAPEIKRGGPRIAPRKSADYSYLADTIRTLGAKVLALQEVNAYRRGGRYRSRELRRLVRALGSKHWRYAVSRSGWREHLAFVYDRRVVQAKAFCEARFSWKMVGDRPTFFRQPFAAHFALLDGRGKAQNDFTMINLHLVSGQHRVKNHDQAMVQLLHETKRKRWFKKCIPPGEQDLMIAGDLNASRFDHRREKFWSLLELTGWDILADSRKKYPPTRLSGVPLRLRQSHLDYIIIRKGPRGLAGREIRARTARVHTELVKPSSTLFRRRASDHLPVTVRIRRVPDDD